jgi:hypothetical protein
MVQKKHTKRVLLLLGFFLTLFFSFSTSFANLGKFLDSSSSGNGVSDKFAKALNDYVDSNGQWLYRKAVMNNLWAEKIKQSNIATDLTNALNSLKRSRPARFRPWKQRQYYKKKRFLSKLLDEYCSPLSLFDRFRKKPIRNTLKCLSGVGFLFFAGMSFLGYVAEHYEELTNDKNE